MYLSVIALNTNSLTKRSVLILEEGPNTVANLKQIASVFSINKFSAAHFDSPYTEIGFNGESSVHSELSDATPYPLFVFGNRIFLPLFIPSLVILGFCLIAINRELINNNLIKIIIFLAGIFIIIVGEILLNLSSKINHINLFLFITPFLFLIINKLLLNYLLTYQKNKS